MTSFRCSLILLVFLMALGCSKSNNKAGILDATGKHPANWIQNHASFFRQTPGATDSQTAAQTTSCAECHGSDLKGGIVKVSCFSQGFGATTCHFHPTGYAGSQVHGATAKGAPTFSSGLDSCRGCHGSGYAGGLLSSTSCFTCHGVNAPHAKNWATSTTSNHSTTDQNNAAACYQCHAGGKFLTNLPMPPAPAAGAQPNCFNNTLCHAGLHPAGWNDPTQHGAAAKSQPGTGAGFNNCQGCHGTDFKGGSSGVSCFSASSANGSCHLRNGSPVNAPHAALPWRAASPSPTHTTTVDDTQGLNAAVCAQCHLKGANLSTPILTTYATGTPSCFNSTLCHGAMGHPAGWADPAQHGATAKANLTYCQTCHADNPTGGPGTNPRFNVVLGNLTAGCETCHEASTAHPPVLQIPASFGITSPDPLGTPWFRHRTATNFDACNRCHGAALAGGVGPRCQNCHVGALPTATISSADPCSSCHSQPPSGTTYPNINRVHSSHTALNVPTGGLCTECHSGLGSGTLDHFLRAKNIELGTATSTQAGAVVFGGVLSTANGATPTFTLATLTCANTYCHGSTMASNTSNPPASRIATPAWNTPFLGVASVVGNGSTTPGSGDCATCHGYPPMISPHSGVTATQCITCHTHVNSTGTGFTDATKHINGTVDVTAGTAHAVPNYNHQSAGTGSACTGCHTIGTATSVYPAAVLGNPPDCRGCHKKGAPGTGCNSCHGDAATGRPNATAFPDKTGRHQGSGDGAHLSAACSKCHILTTSGTGTTVNHGPGNRDTNPDIVGPGFITGITITGATKGVSPSATCNHTTINANNGGGCGGGPSSATW